MSSGKRLAKRSIIGARVCCPHPSQDGYFFPCAIQATRTGHSGQNRYSVKFVDGTVAEVKETELIGQGFRSIASIGLKKGQKVYITLSGKEVQGIVISHQMNDEVLVAVSGQEHPVLHVSRRIQEVRLTESRKSARLADHDTDYVKLANIHAHTQKRAVSGVIDVPSSNPRKRTSASLSEDVEAMDEQIAAMALTSLSCSPVPSHITRLQEVEMWAAGSEGGHSSSYSSWDTDGSWKSSPSPPSRLPVSAVPTPVQVFTGNSTDEGIGLEEAFDEPSDESSPRKKRLPSRKVYQCTWQACGVVSATRSAVERHIRHAHLMRQDNSDSDLSDDHEEEFYYTEIEVNVDNITDSLQHMNMSTSPAPTQSHMDMVRPPHEDPIYKDHQYGIRPVESTFSAPVNIPQIQRSLSWQASTSGTNSVSLQSQGYRSIFYQRQQQHQAASPKSPTYLCSTQRSSKGRGEGRKCRKVYGMDNRDLWCTQCRWKKACSRSFDSYA
ncbi:PREDICTED: zinc finger protein 704-like [Priapulus caudatus]|uniref:Zinc finger protein 704-like n=1 Tax=Priapulus caudatus TaxID=37621 RepID=A0ABM1E8U8_PRICU|nr:PREDICTED: zinc finger protein 704-like [Priapulus caudatus]